MGSVKYLVIPFLFFSFLYCYNTGVALEKRVSHYRTVPSKYVDLPSIRYNEKGFLTETGEQYINLPYKSGPSFKEWTSVPVFSYNPHVPYKEHSWHNIYETKIGYDVTIYSTNPSNYLYVKEEEYERTMITLGMNCIWRRGSVDGSIIRDENMKDIMTSYLKKAAEMEKFDNLNLSNQVVLMRLNSKETILLDSIDIFIDNDTGYLLLKEDVTFTSNVCYGFKLSDEEKDICEKVLFGNTSWINVE